jgi:hypothetical protein
VYASIHFEYWYCIKSSPSSFLWFYELTYGPLLQSNLTVHLPWNRDYTRILALSRCSMLGEIFATRPITRLLPTHGVGISRRAPASLLVAQNRQIQNAVSLSYGQTPPWPVLNAYKTCAYSGVSGDITSESRTPDLAVHDCQDSRMDRTISRPYIGRTAYQKLSIFFRIKRATQTATSTYLKPPGQMQTRRATFCIF